MNDKDRLEFLKDLAKAIAGEFGSDCEVVVHDLESDDMEHSIVAIENGHVTNRRVGDGPSHVVLEALKKPEELRDHIGYLTKTDDGKILKSTTVFVRNAKQKIVAIFAVNFNITSMMIGLDAVRSIVGSDGEEQTETITNNVNDLLEDLIEEAIRMTGKPVALMSKSDKVRAVNFLNDAGALLITKSSEKICSSLDISKYALYSYLDQKTESAG